MRVSHSNALVFQCGGVTFPAEPRALEMQGMLRRWDSNGDITKAGKMNSKCVFQVDFYKLDKCRGSLEQQAMHRGSKLGTY